MAAADLVQLIDLSLGSQPCGVVNFNYLHGLLHEIVKRLFQLEQDQSAGRHIVGPAGLKQTEHSHTQSQDGGTSTEQASTSASTEKEEGGGGVEREGSPGSTGGTPIHPSGSTLDPRGSQLLSPRSRPSIVTAANDLSALERKLQALELRVNTMESLPDMLERKSSDSQATPVHDMWNFTILGKRLSATEDGLDKVSGSTVSSPNNRGGVIDDLAVNLLPLHFFSPHFLFLFLSFLSLFPPLPPFFLPSLPPLSPFTDL